MTRKGCSSIMVTPSTLTLPSSITSGRAACVREEVRLISSARNRLVKTAPLRICVFPVCGSITLKPVTSAGNTSTVNCILRQSSCMAIVVFPTPGISSMRICPLANIAIRIFSSSSSFPMTAFLTSCNIRSLVLIRSPFSQYAFWLSPIKNHIYTFIVYNGVHIRSTKDFLTFYEDDASAILWSATGMRIQGLPPACPAV